MLFGIAASALFSNFVTEKRLAQRSDLTKIFYQQPGALVSQNSTSTTVIVNKNGGTQIINKLLGLNESQVYNLIDQRLNQYLAEGKFKGDKGDTGPQGPAGPQGIQGVQGPQGPQGVSGNSPSLRAELVDDMFDYWYISNPGGSFVQTPNGRWELSGAGSTQAPNAGSYGGTFGACSINNNFAIGTTQLRSAMNMFPWLSSMSGFTGFTISHRLQINNYNNGVVTGNIRRRLKR